MVIVIAAILFIITAVVYLRGTRAVPVLMYHRISDIPGDRISMPPAKFADQMRYLRDRGFHAISLAELHRHLTAGTPLPPRPVVLTFDDGYEDNLTHALPIMREHGMTGTVFVISDWVGRTNDWESYPGKPTRPLMTWEQLRAWSQAGMEIAGHTRRHPFLTQLSDEQIRQELVESKREIEARLEMPIDFLCYPYGDVDARVARLTREAGYLGGVAIFEMTPVWRDDPYLLRRVVMSARQSPRSFALKVSPFHLLTIWARQAERAIRRAVK